MELRKKIGLHLRMLRESFNYTQSQIASHLGVATNTYSLMEKGLAQLTLDRVAKLAALYNITPQELIAINPKKQAKGQPISSLSSHLSVLDLSLAQQETENLDISTKELLLKSLARVDAQVADLQQLIDSIRESLK